MPKIRKLPKLPLEPKRTDAYKCVPGQLDLNTREAQKAIQFIQNGRIKLATRMRHLVLFPESLPEKDRGVVGWRGRSLRDDHPLVQIMFQMRDEVLKSEDPGHRSDMLGKLATLAGRATMEAHRASVELQSLLHEAATMEQRKKEHVDKLEVARERLTGEKKAIDTKSDSELQKLIDAKKAELLGTLASEARPQTDEERAVEVDAEEALADAVELDDVAQAIKDLDNADTEN